MAASSQLGLFRVALKAALTVRAGLATVAVTRFRPSADDEVATEHIWFDEAEGEQKPAAPGSRFDDLALTLVIKVRLAGDGEEIAAAAEDRALALFAEVEAAVTADLTLSGLVLDCNIGRYATKEQIEPGNRICRLEAAVTGMTQIDNS